MRYLILVLIFCFAGCASLPMPGYINRVDHPYDRRFYANFEKVSSAFLFVLKNKGWAIDTEANPFVYERDDRYENNGYTNLLIITKIRSEALHLTRMHLNVLIHAISNTCDVQVRYEARRAMIKQFISVRNDQLVQGILDAVEQEVGR